MGFVVVVVVVVVVVLGGIARSALTDARVSRCTGAGGCAVCMCACHAV